MKKPKLLLLGIIIGLLIACASWFGSLVYGSNTAFSSESVLVFIPTGTDMTQLENRLSEKGIIKSTSSFQWTSRLKRFKNPKPGRYRISKGMSNNHIINLFRSGNQEAVSIKLDGVKTLADLAGRLSKSLERDSTSFANYFLDPNLADSLGFNSATFSAMFIANTYQFYWNTDAQSFLSKMNTIYKKYWTEKRIAEAQELGLNPIEVATLASIVQGETGQMIEAPEIAGLYLNRLRDRMPLQSDPTVLFALNKKGIQRVLHGDLDIESPYNTYRNVGLPPGPICLTSEGYLDAVIHHSNNNYIYMCAQPGNTGYHNFARSYEQHLRNAADYQHWLDKKGINR